MVCIDDCSNCKHNHLEKIDNWIPVCDAFPKGMPLDFPTGRAHEFKECNNGIGYEPKED